MSRRRYLSTDAGRDKALRDVARQSMFAHSFYLLAIPCAGDDCTLPTNDPDELLWEVWPSMARDYATEDVEAAIGLLIGAGLWEYAPDGSLRYPPASYYKHQTYIREDRRGSAKGAAPERNAPETAHDSPSISESAQNSAEQRTSAQNRASFSSSFSSSSSVSSSESPTTPVDRIAPVAVAPDASQPSRNGTFSKAERDAMWDAVAAECGDAVMEDTKSLRGKVVGKLLAAHYSPVQVRTAAATYRRRYAVDLTDTALVKHIDRLLTTDDPIPKVQERPSRAADIKDAINDFGRTLDDAGYDGRTHGRLPAVRPQLRGLPS